MFAPNWSAKAEYQYYNFGSTTFTGGPARDRRRPLPRRRAHRQGRHQLPLRLGWPGRSPNTERNFRRITQRIGKGRLRAGLFVVSRPGAAGPFQARPKNNFRPRPELVTAIGYYAGRPGWWTTNMRVLASVLIFSAVALPCAAQTILKSEPLCLRPMRSPSCRTLPVRPARCSRSPARSGACTAGRPAWRSPPSRRRWRWRRRSGRAPGRPGLFRNCN